VVPINSARNQRDRQISRQLERRRKGSRWLERNAEKEGRKEEKEEKEDRKEVEVVCPFFFSFFSLEPRSSRSSFVFWNDSVNDFRMK